MKATWAIGIGIALVAIVAGVFIASRLTLPGISSPQETPRASLIIREIILGTPTNASEASKPNPVLRQQATYQTNQPLALRLTTQAATAQSFTIQVRLLTDKGNVVILKPASLTMRSGVGAYCCWQISQEGKYSFQVFRPDGGITSIPLTIIKAYSSGASQLQILH
jgi:hypothetical protein